MKKITIIVLFLTGLTAMAQNEEGPLKNRKHNLTIEQAATLRTKKMTLALDLTDSQQKQIQELHIENTKLQRAIREKRKAIREEGSNKKPTSEERYAMQIERLDYQIAQKTQMKKILSKEQLEKWEQLRYRKGKHQKGKHKKGKEKRE